MAPETPVHPNDRRRATSRTRPSRERLAAQLQDVARRLERTERRLAMLEKATDGLARHSGISIGCPCTRCERSYLLCDGGTFSCPVCGYSQSI